MAELVEHALGCHLRQRHEDYLQDHGLGYSAVKDLYLSPVEWWDSSVHNPLRPDTSDDHSKLAYFLGTALHMFVLDGEKFYNRAYGRRPTRESHPDALDSVEQLRAACDSLGLGKASRKEDLIHKLVSSKRCPWPILADLQMQFDLSGKKAISFAHDARIRILHRQMMRDREELKLADDDGLTLRDALDGGLSEVSIYWVDDNGIRQRARFDRLKPNITLDLKSITRWKKGNFKKELLREIILRGYMIQVAHYHEARIQLRKAVAEGRVYGGTKTERKLLERIARSDYWAWVFVFAKMDGAAQVQALVIRQESGQFIKAQQQREEALANFLWHREFHGGLDKPWFDPDVVWEPADTDWPEFSVLGQ
jgi:hypothetical protein